MKTTKNIFYDVETRPDGFFVRLWLHGQLRGDVRRFATKKAADDFCRRTNAQVSWTKA